MGIVFPSGILAPGVIGMAVDALQVAKLGDADAAVAKL